MDIKFGSVAEKIVTRKEFPLKKAQKVLKGKTIAVLGYGIQGPGQALNMRDNGINVIVGQRKSTKANSSWKRAIKDGWVPGKTLFSIEEAAAKGDVIMMLTSDASQPVIWKAIEKYVTPGKALYFSHGFGYVYNKLTGIKPQKGVMLVMVAPKGSGTSVRRNFLSGAGINSSYAYEPNGADEAKTRELTIAIGIAVGSGYLFPTTFEREVTSDLVGERGILMGALCGVMEAQFYTLRANGHSPSEAFNETCEELTQSLIRLVDERAQVAPDLPQGGRARLQEALREREDDEGGEGSDPRYWPSRLQGVHGRQVAGNARWRDVAGRRCCALAPSAREGQGQCGDRRWRPRPQDRVIIPAQRGAIQPSANDKGEESPLLPFVLSWWAVRDSDPRPNACKALALTN